MMTQTARLLDYLQNHPNGIEPMTALEYLGVFRLAARVTDLKKAGYSIETDTIEVRNRWNERCRVSRYRLVDAADYGVVV